MLKRFFKTAWELMCAIFKDLVDEFRGTRYDILEDDSLIGEDDDDDYNA